MKQVARILLAICLYAFVSRDSDAESVREENPSAERAQIIVTLEGAIQPGIVGEHEQALKALRIADGVVALVDREEIQLLKLQIQYAGGHSIVMDDEDQSEPVRRSALDIPRVAGPDSKETGKTDGRATIAFLMSSVVIPAIGPWALALLVLGMIWIGRRLLVRRSRT